MELFLGKDFQRGELSLLFISTQSLSAPRLRGGQAPAGNDSLFALKSTEKRNSTLKFLNLSSPDAGEDDESSTDTITKTQKNFRVVLFNDESHTYDYVVEMLTLVCKLSRQAAFRCAVEVDVTGKTIVYYGTHDDCMLIVNKITSYGPDHRLPHSMGSMAAEVQ
jgi:ATP-dependent Clp protease adaptor protein ClpS